MKKICTIAESLNDYFYSFLSRIFIPFAKCNDCKCVFFSVQKFLFVAKFFSVYLSHVRVADYTVTHLTRSKVKDLMADTQSKVLTPLVELIVNDKVCVYYLIMVFCIDLENFNLKCYQNYQIQFYLVFFVKSEQCHIDSKTLFVCSQVVGESLVFSALLLCFTWGELHLLLEEFVPNNERSQCHDPNLYRNLEAIFTISSKTWKKLQTLATTRAPKKNCYLWVKNFRFCEIFMMIFM